MHVMLGSESTPHPPSTMDGQDSARYGRRGLGYTCDIRKVKIVTPLRNSIAHYSNVESLFRCRGLPSGVKVIVHREGINPYHTQYTGTYKRRAWWVGEQHTWLYSRSCAPLLLAGLGAHAHTRAQARPPPLRPALVGRPSDACRRQKVQE